MSRPPVFPGGTAVTRLRPYDWPAADAPGGSGSPHLHTVATEAYVVVGGTGAVQTLSSDGFAQHPLHDGAIVWFSPGVVHRILAGPGLDVLVVMSDAGIPESGDAVLTMPPEVLADPAAYREAVVLPTGATEQVAAAARARRDLALEGFQALRTAVEQDGPSALAPLHAAAARLVEDQVAAWCDHGATRSAANATDRALAAMDPASHDDAVTHLADGRVTGVVADSGDARFGMCGRLKTWRDHDDLPSAVALPRGTPRTDPS